jgi:DNA-binding NarL/FixJ family response regulator
MRKDLSLGIVSQHVLTRKAVSVLLASSENLRVTVDVDSALESVELLQKAQLDILLLDILDPSSGLESVSRLRSLLPEIKLLLLSDPLDEEFQVRAIRAGAHGCVSKRAEPSVLEKALRLVAKGELWVSHQVAAQIIGKLMVGQQAEDGNAGDVSQREWEILALVARGYRNKEIASRLFISENTIKSHLATIYRKLHVNTRLEAALHYFHETTQTGNRPAVPFPASAESPPVLSRIET